MSAPIVFFDIAGPRLEEQAAFYRSVFGWEIGPDPNFPEHGMRVRNVPVTSPLEGTLRKDPPERLFYIGVADVAATAETIDAHGGAIGSPRMAVPGVVILALFTDPAGNRMGIVEMDGDRVKIP